MKSLQAKQCLITGAGGGIGRAIALALARRGAALHLLDIHPENLALTVEQCKGIGAEARGEICDIGNPAAVSAAVANVLARWGGVDVLVNNAGIVYCGPTENMTTEQWDRLLGVNLLGAIQLTRELLPAMLKRGDCHILNVSSIGGLVSRGRTAAYHVSKFALVGFSESLRLEYCRSGIGVTALCPGFVKTDLLNSAMNGHPSKPVPQPPWWACTSADRVADIAVRAIRKNRGLVVITIAGKFAWFLKRLSPRLLDFLVREGWRKGKGKREKG